MTDRFADYDAFAAEREGVGPVVKAGGVEHQLPPELPASVALRVLRAIEAGKCPRHPEGAREGCRDCEAAIGEQVTMREMLDMVHEVCGPAAPAILPHVGMRHVPEFLQMLIALYNGGGGPSPNRATRRAAKRGGGRHSTSSPTGRRSSRTSSASTGSTPPRRSRAGSAGAASGSSSPT
jgi:hypothetical protein